MTQKEQEDSIVHLESAVSSAQDKVDANEFFLENLSDMREQFICQIALCGLCTGFSMAVNGFMCPLLFKSACCVPEVAHTDCLTIWGMTAGPSMIPALCTGPFNAGMCILDDRVAEENDGEGILNSSKEVSPCTKGLTTCCITAFLAAGASGVGGISAASGPVSAKAMAEAGAIGALNYMGLVKSLEAMHYEISRRNKTDHPKLQSPTSARMDRAVI